jgi:LPXTG-site transpeptidase (sortase) family protein
MNRLVAKIVLVTSCVVLVVVAVLLVGAADEEPRADLVGPEVTSITETLPPTPVTVPQAVGSPTTTTTEPDPGVVPQRLQIPSLGLDAPVVPVGLEGDGSMQIPGATESGWYWPGTAPGAQTGSAVIAAHVDYAGQRGVFFDLRTVEVGSEISVLDEQGVPLRYVITERFQVDKDLLPIDELFRANGSHTLTLITCGGGFDASSRSYADNIVVRAVPA